MAKNIPLHMDGAPMHEKSQGFELFTFSFSRVWVFEQEQEDGGIGLGDFFAVQMDWWERLCCTSVLKNKARLALVHGLVFDHRHILSPHLLPLLDFFVPLVFFTHWWQQRQQENMSCRGVRSKKKRVSLCGQKERILPSLQKKVAICAYVRRRRSGSVKE